MLVNKQFILSKRKRELLMGILEESYYEKLRINAEHDKDVARGEGRKQGRKEGKKLVERKVQYREN